MWKLKPKQTMMQGTEMINSSTEKIQVWVCRGCRGLGISGDLQSLGIIHGRNCCNRNKPYDPDFVEKLTFYSQPPAKEDQQNTSDNPISKRLIDFLYTLARDHVPMGDIETIMFDFVSPEPGSYCNHFLEGYARDLAKRLLDDNTPITNWKHMYRSPDGKIKFAGGDNPHYDGS